MTYYPEVTRAVERAIPRLGSASIKMLARWTGFGPVTVRNELFALRLQGRVRRRWATGKRVGMWERCG